MLNNNIFIRKFNNCDREDIRRISCDTAFLEEPRKVFFDDDEILADALTLYFTDYEPDSCFVAVKNDKIIGYIIGTTDVKLMQKIFFIRIIPLLIIKALNKRIIFKRNTLNFLIHILLSLLKGEFIRPDFSKKYPATLHINIDKAFRRQNIGKQLIEYYLKFLKEKNVSGVHFGVMSESAKEFFMKFNFNILFRSKLSYLRYYLGKFIPYYILGNLLK
jgi:ribosomal protein S18 acetylase RimI-like enzyme